LTPLCAGYKMIKYTINVTQDKNYACVEALYRGDTYPTRTTLALYGPVLDNVITGLLGSTHRIEVLSRRTVYDVVAHEYRITTK